MQCFIMIVVRVQIYRSVLLSSRHHRTDEADQSCSPSAERKTRRDKASSGNLRLFQTCNVCS